jgi:uncharacterized protein YggT (Ycf19 family)
MNISPSHDLALSRLSYDVILFALYRPVIYKLTTPIYRVLRVFLFPSSNVDTSIISGYPYIYVLLFSQILTHVCSTIVCINEFVYFNL